jgi:hypothetical protein
MDKKHMKLPKDGLVEPEERQGLIDDGDVEGHGLPTTAPPTAFGDDRRPRGGDITAPTDGDDDGKGASTLKH